MSRKASRKKLSLPTTRRLSQTKAAIYQRQKWAELKEKSPILHQLALAAKRDYREANSYKWKSRKKARRKAKLAALKQDPAAYEQMKQKRQEYARHRYREVGSGKKNRYRLKPGEYQSLLKKQKGRCAICRCNSPNRRGYGWSVDHDHRTGKVRGLLCYNCNFALGQVRENISILRNMIRYLKKHK